MEIINAYLNLQICKLIHIHHVHFIKTNTHTHTHTHTHIYIGRMQYLKLICIVYVFNESMLN